MSAEAERLNVSKCFEMRAGGGVLLLFVLLGFVCLLESFVVFSLLVGTTTSKLLELRVKKTQRLG